MKRQSRCNEQHDEVPQPPEVDLVCIGHGHEVHSSVEGAGLKWVMQHIKTISIKSQSICNEPHDEVPQPQEVNLGGLRHGHEVQSSVEVAVLKEVM